MTLSTGEAVATARSKARRLGRWLNRYYLPHAVVATYAFTCAIVALPLLLQPERHAQTWTYGKLAESIRLDWFGATMLIASIMLMIAATVGGLPKLVSFFLTFIASLHMIAIAFSAAAGAASAPAATANTNAYSGLCLWGALAAWACLLDRDRS